jgi:hypothetical protein
VDLFAIKAVPTIVKKFEESFLDGLEIELSGPAHEQTNKAERERDDALTTAGIKGLKGGAAKDITNAYLAARMIRWNAQANGADLPLTTENALAVLGNPNLRVIRMGLLGAIGDDEANYKSS